MGYRKLCLKNKTQYWILIFSFPNFTPSIEILDDLSLTFVVLGIELRVFLTFRLISKDYVSLSLELIHSVLLLLGDELQGCLPLRPSSPAVLALQTYTAMPDIYMGAEDLNSGP